MPTPFSSARAQAAIGTRTGYRRRFRFTFTRDGVSAVLEPTSGTFTQDARRSGRWDGRLTFTGDQWVPRRPGDLLTPFGTRVTAEMGIELLDGSAFYVPYGVYEIVSAGTDDSASDRTTTVGLSDLSGAIERYRFETSFSLGFTVTLPQMVNRLVLDRTGLNPNVIGPPTILGAPVTFGLETGTGPWSEMLETLDAWSYTAWYDRTGQIQMGTTAVNAGDAYPLPLIASLSADFDNRPANVVVARGEGTDAVAPVQAVAMDTDPGSPTYAGVGPGTSPYGRTTEYFTSPLLLTTGQALSAARAILAANIGAGASYTITSPYDPTIDAGDIVSAEGLNFVIDSVTVDITGDTTSKARLV